MSLRDEKKKLLDALSPEELKLFEWVREREKRGDWSDLKKAVGKPSPRLRIVEYVRKLISETKKDN